MANNGVYRDPTQETPGQTTENQWFLSLSFQTVENLEVALKADQSLVKTTGLNNQILLHRAVLYCKLPIVNLLLKYASDPNCCDNDGRTPAHVACVKGRLDILVALVQFSADLTITDNFGQNCMHHAASAGSVLIMHYLNIVHNMSHLVKDKNDITPAHVACNNGQLDTIRYLLRNDRIKVDSIDCWGNSILHLAAFKGADAICWSIVSHSADGAKLLTHKDAYQRSPVDLIPKDTKSMRQKILLEYLTKWQEYYMHTNKAIPEPNVLSIISFLFAPGWFLATLIICKLLPFISNYMIAVPSFLFLMYRLLHKTHRISHPSRKPEGAFGGLFVSGFIISVISYFYITSAYVYCNAIMNVASILAVSATAYFLASVFLADHGVVGQAPQRTSTRSNYSFSRQDLSMLHIPIEFNFSFLKSMLSRRSINVPQPDHSIADVALGFSSEGSFCETCEIVKPDKVRHCKLCDSCCWMMDHHCLFVMNCVAGLNQRPFFFMLLSVFCGNIMFLLSIYTYWSSAFFSFTEALSHGWHSDITTITMFLGNSLCILWTSSMLMYQINYISNKTSTVNQIKNKFQPKKPTSFKERVKNMIHFLKTGIREGAILNSVSVY